MAADMLISLLKGGGIAALAIGVVYLIYTEIVKLGIFPKLKQWQAFALLCLLAILVFVVAVTAIRFSKPEQVLLQGELPPDNHFQLDAAEGVFCENNNVRGDFAPYFDYVDIALVKCNGTTDSASRQYRIAWLPRGPRNLVSENRQNYRQCFASDFAGRAPKFVNDLQQAFKRNKERIPCEVSLSVWRVIQLSYIDLRDQSHTVAFVQSYNHGNSGRLRIEQIPALHVAQSDQMQEFDAGATGSKLDDDLVSIARQFNFPNVPSGN
jgi:hypothetical protein